MTKYKGKSESLSKVKQQNNILSSIVKKYMAGIKQKTIVEYKEVIKYIDPKDKIERDFEKFAEGIAALLEKLVT